MLFFAQFLYESMIFAAVPLHVAASDDGSAIGGGVVSNFPIEFFENQGGEGKLNFSSANLLHVLQSASSSSSASSANLLLLLLHLQIYSAATTVTSNSTSAAVSVLAESRLNPFLDLRPASTAALRLLDVQIRRRWAGAPPHAGGAVPPE
ncbi:hypothetical protein C2S52_018452 [Perilla frutescens var. hirtella]|nr:hypothetical protein C2S52_018452 [Perilla frutescens var. hirtella]